MNSPLEWVMTSFWILTAFLLLSLPKSRPILSCKGRNGIAQTAFAKASLLFLKEKETEAEGDEDMKIVREGSLTLGKAESGEDEINSYFRHKRCGNIELAKALGEEIGAEITAFRLNAQTALFLEKEAATEAALLEEITASHEWDLLEDQARMLYVYTGEKAAKKDSPDSILRQMVIASLGDCMNQNFPGLYTRMAECRAYTVYKLSSSRNGGVEHAIGAAYAQMVGHKNEEAYIVLGTALFERMTEKCRSLCAAVVYHNQTRMGKDSRKE